MQRFARFLVDHSKVIFIVMMVAMVAAACLIPRVNVNKDMTQYIPSYMQSKIGLDLMADEFGDSSLFRVMFEGVPDGEQEGLADALEEVPGVTDVLYDDSDDYHNGDYTLYEVTVAGGTYDPEAHEAYESLQAFAEETGYTHYFDSAVIDAELPNLGLIIAFGTLILTIIMLIMSKSWFEPVLLLATLGVAIILNTGTNVVFPSVSDTTNSIAAIFQLVLSLDYSVMLMSRYREERQKTDDVREAMGAAIANAARSIASSALTTIVGMVCLLLMSFTIGRDMGLVFAKGVLCSLICVFTVMPMLVMAFDKILQRTPKKAPHPAMALWTRVSARGRIPLLLAFLLIFGLGFSLRGLAEAGFVLPSLNADKQVVEEAFPAGSQVIVLYTRDDEDKAADLVDILEDMDHVIDVKSYASTLGASYTADELADEMDIDPTFARLLYYYEGNGDGYRSMTAHQFALLIRNDILSNPSFQSRIPAYNRSQIDQFVTITDADVAEEERTASEMADFFEDLGGSSAVGLTEEQMQQLYLLYFLQGPGSSESGGSSMALPDFVDFLLNDVVNNEMFAGQISEEQVAQIQQMQAYTDVGQMTAQMPAEYMANALGMDAQQVGMLYMFAGKETMSIQEFFGFVVQLAQDNPQVGAMIPAEQLAQMSQALQIINASVSGTAFSAGQMAQMLGMSEDQVATLYRYREYTQGGASSWTMSALELVDFLLSDQAQEVIGDAMSDSDYDKMESMQAIMESAVNGTTYQPSGMLNLLTTLARASGTSIGSMNLNSMTLLYLYRDARDLGDSDKTMTLEDFVMFVADDVIDSSLFSSFVDDDMRDDITEAKTEIVDSKDQLVGAAMNRIIVRLDVASESDEMADFVHAAKDYLASTMSRDYFLVGEGPMTVDMSEGFMDELNFITLVTAAAIFLIVLLTFRNLLIPIILVAMIQSSFFWTMALNGLLGSAMYYVAIIIVQAILMGATIDYAILFTSNYRQQRESKGVEDALAGAYAGSIPTMLTSGTILVVVTFIIGTALGPATSVGQICLTIAEGASIALLLVVFVLPGVLAALDRWVGGKNRLVEGEPEDGEPGLDAALADEDTMELPAEPAEELAADPTEDLSIGPTAPLPAAD